MRRVTSLNRDWEFNSAAWQQAPGKVGYSVLEWQTARVPGCIHLDLIDRGIIADPFERLAELGCQWVDEQDWHYRTEFTFEPDPRLPKRILRFAGLDTVCAIFLNGAKIGESDNMFIELELDVSDALLSGRNQLRIEFDSASRVGRARRAAYFAAHALPATTVRLEPAAFVRKAQYMFGWDWGPRLVSAGIWRPIELVECAARIVDVAVTQRHCPDGAVELEFHSECEGPERVYHFVEGFDAALRDGETLRIPQPKFWWPRGMGEPSLYAVTSLLAERPPASPSQVEGVSDRFEQRIGLRSLELVRQPDRFGESFRFKINGRDLYALGANWIPDDSFPSRVDRQRLQRQLASACSLGMNMLRVWGGGFYESDDFYALCDELGLLVWQDFPYACSYYPDDAAACAVARREAAAAVRRLRNHPSLAIWCGNNENQTMRDGGWEGAEHHPLRFHGERIFEVVLPELLAAMDPARPYIPSSPFGKGEANAGGEGDQHYWDVWHGRGDWRYYADSDARFCSEFGFASAPGRAAWETMGKGSALLSATVRDPVARWHDKTGKAGDTFVALVELHYPKSETIEQWAYYSQLNQRDALRFGIEHYRRGEICRGTLIWQLNDCWPVQSWSVIDSAFEWKAAAHELKRLYAPLLVSLERQGDCVRLWGILDNTGTPEATTVVLQIHSSLDGQLLERRELVVNLMPGERRLLDSVDVAQYPLTRTIVSADARGSRSFLLLCEPKELELQAPGEITIRPTDSGIVVESPVPVVDLWLTDPDHAGEFLDNCITMPTGGRQILRSRGRIAKPLARSLAGVHRVVVEPS